MNWILISAFVYLPNQTHMPVISDILSVHDTRQECVERLRSVVDSYYKNNYSIHEYSYDEESESIYLKDFKYKFNKSLSCQKV